MSTRHQAILKSQVKIFNLGLLLWVMAALSLLGVTGTYGAEKLTGATRFAFVRVMNELVGSTPETKRTIDEIFKPDQPLFIFIPGILGSGLKDSEGNIVWGEVTWNDVLGRRRGLIFDPDKKLTPFFLKSFKTLGFKTDIYGKFNEFLRRINLSDIQHFLPFPYDWRQDIKTTAKQFEEFLQDKKDVLRGRKVYIVAHSMGGLVARWWYQKFYKIKRDDEKHFTLIEMMFLGTPHYGAPSTLGQILEGYCSSNCGTFDRSIYSYFFRELNDVAFTFPSIYQLLPFEEAVFEVGEDGRSHPVDPFSIKVWQGYKWGNGVWDKLGIEKGAFYAMVEKYLNEARNFHPELKKEQPFPGSTYFYGTAYNTVGSVKVLKKGRKVIYEELPGRGGDGRVPSNIAKNYRAKVDPARLRPLTQEEHYLLANDDGFKEHLDNLEFYTSQTLAKLVSYIELDSQKVDLFLKETVFLPITVKDALSPDQNSVLIANFNARILGVGETFSSNREIYAKAKDSESKGNKEAADSIYKSYIILTGVDQPESFHAINRLGLNYKDKASDKAVLLFKKAVAIEPPENPKSNKAKAYNNLGVALEKSGKISEATKSYKKSLDFQENDNARSNLSRIRKVVKAKESAHEALQ